MRLNQLDSLPLPTDIGQNKAKQIGGKTGQHANFF